MLWMSRSVPETIMVFFSQYKIIEGEGMVEIMRLMNLITCNKFIQLVIIAVVSDTLFGILRAIREHKFNSSVGIDGVIRKTGMIFSLVFLIVLDQILQINLISILPKEVREVIGVGTIGLSEFFSLLYIAYEVVSILKNMALCGLPVKNLWLNVYQVLEKYTNELPDTKKQKNLEASEREEEPEDSKQ